MWHGLNVVLIIRKCAFKFDSIERGKLHIWVGDSFIQNSWERKCFLGKEVLLGNRSFSHFGIKAI